jgi:hypothetical protein
MCVRLLCGLTRVFQVDAPEARQPIALGDEIIDLVHDLGQALVDFG